MRVSSNARRCVRRLECTKESTLRYSSTLNARPLPTSGAESRLWTRMLQAMVDGGDEVCGGVCGVEVLREWIPTSSSGSRQRNSARGDWLVRSARPHMQRRASRKNKTTLIHGQGFGPMETRPMLCHRAISGIQPYVKVETWKTVQTT